MLVAPFLFLLLFSFVLLLICLNGRSRRRLVGRSRVIGGFATDNPSHHQPEHCDATTTQSNLHLNEPFEHPKPNEHKTMLAQNTDGNPPDAIMQNGDRPNTKNRNRPREKK